MPRKYRPLENEIYKEHKNAKHGMARTPFYRCWISMRQRCTDPNIFAYKNYGGRGIKFCEEWDCFENFKKDMYESYIDHLKRHGRKNTTLDREDVNGNYSPDNCVWATRITQANNTRTNNFVSFHGETKTITQWARELGVTPQTVMYRIKKGIELDVKKRGSKNIVELNGETFTLKEISIMYSVSYDTLYGRYSKGIRDEKILINLIKKAI